MSATNQAVTVTRYAGPQRWAKRHSAPRPADSAVCCGARCSDAGCCPYQTQARQRGLFDDKHDPK